MAKRKKRGWIEELVRLVAMMAGHIFLIVLTMIQFQGDWWRGSWIALPMIVGWCVWYSFGAVFLYHVGFGPEEPGATIDMSGWDIYDFKNYH